MESSYAVRRALSALGKKTAYVSPGKMPKFAAETFPAGAKLDCSGFIYWCLRFTSPIPESRMVDHPLYKKVNGGWFETTAIYRDGKESTGYFREIQPAVGAFLVFPDYRGSDGHTHDGHIGMVTEIDPTKFGLARVRKIIHCSLGGWRNHGDAIRETGPEIWLNGHDSICVWYEGFADQPKFGTDSLSHDAELLAASPGGPGETENDTPNYRSLTANGFFSSAPFDLSIPRAIRTNNPGALNVTKWQRAFPGFVGVTAPDAKGNVTSIYVSPENGIGAWHHLFTDRYGYGANGQFTLQELAGRYAGIDDLDHPAVKGYVAGWLKWSPGLANQPEIQLSDDNDMVLLARGMFSHEAGRRSPLHDDQVVEGLRLKRAGKLPSE